MRVNRKGQSKDFRQQDPESGDRDLQKAAKGEQDSGKARANASKLGRNSSLACKAYVLCCSFFCDE